MVSRSIAARSVAMMALTSLIGSQVGCTGGPPAWERPRISRIFLPRPILSNPLTVPNSDFDQVWNKTVAVVNKYFPIASENRLSRTIVTDRQMAATLIEPWSGDSVSFSDRFEATLQTIRKFAIVHIDPAPTGGYLVKVEVVKELEDMAKPDRQAAGRAVFTNDFPINRTREIVGPVPAAIGWFRQGRDPNLEQAILIGISDALFL